MQIKTLKIAVFSLMILQSTSYYMCNGVCRYFAFAKANKRLAFYLKGTTSVKHDSRTISLRDTLPTHQTFSNLLCMYSMANPKRTATKINTVLTKPVTLKDNLIKMVESINAELRMIL